MKKLMKMIIFNSLFLIIFLIQGCTYELNTLDKETYETLINYHETIGKKCIEYINKDSSISSRSKSTLLKKYELMEETLKTKIKVEK